MEAASDRLNSPMVGLNSLLKAWALLAASISRLAKRGNLPRGILSILGPGGGGVLEVTA